MSHTRTVLLMLGVLLAITGVLAEDCSVEVMTNQFEVSFEKNRRSGEIKSLDTVEVSFDFENLQECLGNEEPRLFIYKEELGDWDEVSRGRRRRSTWSWNVAGVKPCLNTDFMLEVGAQQLQRSLAAQAPEALVKHNYRLGSPAEVTYLNIDQVVQWTEVTCATGYAIEMVDSEGGITELEVTESRLSSEVAALGPCQEVEVYIYPFVVDSENRNMRDEAYISFDKFPDFSKGIFEISMITSVSVDMKVQLDSLRCVESLSVEITGHDSDDTLASRVLDENSVDETITFDSLDHETVYEIKVDATSFEDMDQPLMKIKAVRTYYIYFIFYFNKAECDMT